MGRGGTLTVLLLDDSPVFLRTLARDLMRDFPKIVVHTTTDAEDFVRRAPEYDLVGVDLQLTRDPKNRDGFEVLRRLRLLAPARRPAIVVMSAHDSEEDIAEAARLGARYHWGKQHRGVLVGILEEYQRELGPRLTVIADSSHGGRWPAVPWPGVVVRTAWSPGTSLASCGARSPGVPASPSTPTCG